MKITTRYIKDKLYIAENESGNATHIDMRDAKDKKNLSPLEAVLASTATCAAVDIVSMLKKKRKKFIDLSVETTGIRKEDHPRGLTHITSKYTLISPDTSLDTFEKVAKLATYDYCSVAASLSAKVEIICEVLEAKK